MDLKHLNEGEDTPGQSQSTLVLQQEINELQKQLVDLVNEKGSFLDQSVIHLSQKLDLYIVLFQRQHMRKKPFRSTFSAIKLA